MNEATARILIVDDHDRARQSMEDTLRHAAYEVKSCPNAASALRLLDKIEFDIMISDFRMPGMSGMELLRAIMSRPHPPVVILITAYGTINTAVEAMRHGAFDFIEKPFAPAELESLVLRALQTGKALSQCTGGSQPGDVLLGESPQMQALRKRLTAVASTDETVLISGESGTGKELIARTLHWESRRAKKVFVALNCPALSPQMMESELFGHERGAFTGAENERLGRFELADGGTLLLDEISEMDTSLQAKLLRVLQERTFERVGSSLTRQVDVRVIASTNRRLGDEVKNGRFREDLYFRLAVLPITVPPLRERRSDIPLLCQHFLEKTAARLERSPCTLSDQATELMCSYHWPGNVRELENLMTRATVLCQAKVISDSDLHPWFLDPNNSPDPDPNDAAAFPSTASGIPVGLSLSEMERKLIKATLEQFGGHREKASQALGIGVRTLTNKLRSYGYGPRARFSSALSRKELPC
jgi:DNA-binding NtrC family response regulator